MGQCISFNALGLVRTAKIVSHADLYICQSAYRENSCIAQLCSFCAASGFEECKTSPPSNNSDITSLLCADSNEQYGRRANIRNLRVEEIDNEDVCELVVQVPNDIGVTGSIQNIGVSSPARQKHRITPKNYKVCPT